MAMRHWNWRSLLICLVILFLASCAPPAGLPEGPTPIPTLSPVTEVPGVGVPTESPSFAILSYPVRPPSSSEGQKIYDARCAVCHGEDGTGAVPGSRNFQDVDYMRGETPANFYATIAEGRGDMPGFNDVLTSDERWDVVFYVWRNSTSADVLKTGSELYNKNCASCHGEDGSGELLGSADFTDLRQTNQLAPRDMYLTVTQGRGSMPAWQSLLSQEDRWAVIDYLRSFSYDPSLEQEIDVILPTEPAPKQPSAESTCPPDQSNPFAWGDQTTIQAGQAIYLIRCEMCHGADGSGGLPNTPDFTSQEVNRDLLDNPGGYLCTLTEGVGVMPAFGESLSEDELWQVLTFMGSLGP